MLKMERDKRGRFTGEAVDPELLQKWAEEDRRASLAAKVFEKINLPPDAVGLTHKASGAWWMGHDTKAALYGAAFGIAYGMNHGATEPISTLASIFDALGIEKQIIAAHLKNEKASATA